MPRNGSGGYSLPANSWNPAVTQTIIASSDWNACATDLEAAITGSIASDGQTTCSGPIKFASGTSTAPGITYVNDENTGFFRNGADDHRAVAGGVTNAAFTTTGATIYGGNSTTAPSYVFNGNTSTGFGYFASSPVTGVRLYVNGVEYARWSDNSARFEQQVRATAGSQAAPGFSFTAQTSSGMFLSGGSPTLSDQNHELLGSTGAPYYSIRCIGVYNNPGVGGANVYIGPGGNFQRATSSRRYKKDIVSFPVSVEDLAVLEPVTYRMLNPEVEGEHAGFISEDTAENEHLNYFVERNVDGEVEGIFYGPLGAVGAAVLAKYVLALEKRIRELENK